MNSSFLFTMSLAHLILAVFLAYLGSRQVALDRETEFILNKTQKLKAQPEAVEFGYEEWNGSQLVEKIEWTRQEKR